LRRRKVERDLLAGTRTRQFATERLEPNGTTRFDMVLLDQCVIGGHCGIPTEVDFGRGREPAKVERVRFSSGNQQPSLRQIHSGGYVLHSFGTGILVQNANRGWVTGERSFSECVDLPNGNAHRSIVLMML